VEEGQAMNRRAFLLASTGCAVANTAPAKPMYVHEFYVVNLETGKWTKVDDIEEWINDGRLNASSHWVSKVRKP